MLNGGGLYNLFYILYILYSIFQREHTDKKYLVEVRARTYDSLRDLGAKSTP